MIDDLGVDALLVTDRADIRYLSGFRGEDTALLVTRDVALICTDSRFWPQVAEEVEHFELEKTDDLLKDAVAALRGVRPAAALGFQGRSLSYEGYRKLRRLHDGRLRNVGRRVSRLRAVKDDGELALLRRAGTVVDEALAAVVAEGLAGRREDEVAWALRGAMRARGAEDEAFPAIVAGGARGALGHAIPGARRIERGELVVIDCGARVEGYASDITRTYATGEVEKELRRVYDVVHAAQRAGLEAVRAGAHGRDDVDRAARAVVTEAGYGEHFGHGTGHGVGLEVHELPNLGRRLGDRLEAGMVCTVEPGIYFEGRAGVRIEDTVLVTVDGCERLTTSPKEFTVVD
jgi:Xaa-Pro aminopeptidase